MKGNIAVLFLFAVLFAVLTYIILTTPKHLSATPYSIHDAEQKLFFKERYQSKINYLAERGGFKETHLWYCDGGRQVTIENATEEIKKELYPYSVIIDPSVPSIADFEENGKHYKVVESSRYFYIIPVINKWVFNNYLTSGLIDEQVDQLSYMFDNNVSCKIDYKETGPLLIGDCQQYYGRNGTLIKISCEDYYYETNVPFRFSFLIWTSV